MPRSGFVYILASQPNGTLYVGVTSDLPRRVSDHRAGVASAFTAEYGVTRPVVVDDMRCTRFVPDRLLFPPHCHSRARGNPANSAPRAVPALGPRFRADDGERENAQLRKPHDMQGAFVREKQLKKWNRAWKLRLIREQNPTWRDLFEDLIRQPG
ncbi:MAG: hypothetical protein Rubg2KO_07100 [Rubricoccaceae bacterium]